MQKTALLALAQMFYDILSTPAQFNGNYNHFHFPISFQPSYKSIFLSPSLSWAHCTAHKQYLTNMLREPSSHSFIVISTLPTTAKKSITFLLSHLKSQQPPENTLYHLQRSLYVPLHVPQSPYSKPKSLLFSSHLCRIPLGCPLSNS